MTTLSLPYRRSSPRYLCLKCREVGHKTTQCVKSWSRWETGWFFSEARRYFTFDNPDSPDICHRCQKIDVNQFLNESIPWKTVGEFEGANRTGNPLFKKLGKTGNIKFDSQCSLCRCLFALTPNPTSDTQDILLIPNFTIYRVTGEDGAPVDRDEKRKYAKCLVIALEPSYSNTSAFIGAHRGDALCPVEDPSTVSTLGGRVIAKQINDPGIVNEWLSLCSNRHGPECSPIFNDDLSSIRLIDVHKRVTINYPGGEMRYAALSYVWGPVEQPTIPLGAEIGKLPRTIEDAVACAKDLGFRYLWIDSICIEQSNQTHKMDQINRMYSIYRGAAITLIALSGRSVDAGLPRMSSQEPIHSQLQCSVNGKRLVGLMPTLSNQIWVAAWGKRAWTLQEAMLSPRCLYMSDHGLYFECAAMQCCEALDQKRSWAHNVTPFSSPSEECFQTWVYEENGPGCLRIPLDSPERRLWHWGRKITLYSYRTMSKDFDALNAFKGIEQRLESIYPKGFFWGLPIEDFQWGLLWCAQRSKVRRHNFPSWSWVGWKVGVWHGAPEDETKPRQFPLDIRIWKLAPAGWEILFETRYRSSLHGTAKDPFQDIPHQPSNHRLFFSNPLSNHPPPSPAFSSSKPSLYSSLPPSRPSTAPPTPPARANTPAITSPFPPPTALFTSCPLTPKSPACLAKKIPSISSWREIELGAGCVTIYLWCISGERWR